MKDINIKKEICQWLSYVGITAGVFIIDISVLYVLVEYAGAREFVGAAVGFMVKMLISYFFVRRYVFKESKQTLGEGLVMFLGFAFIGIILVSGLMFLAVDVFDYNYLVSRVVIACVIGFMNYLANYKLNFKL